MTLGMEPCTWNRTQGAWVPAIVEQHFQLVFYRR